MLEFRHWDCEVSPEQHNYKLIVFPSSFFNLILTSFKSMIDLHDVVILMLRTKDIHFSNNVEDRALCSFWGIVKVPNEGWSIPAAVFFPVVFVLFDLVPCFFCDLCAMEKVHHICADAVLNVCIVYNCPNCLTCCLNHLLCDLARIVIYQ